MVEKSVQKQTAILLKRKVELFNVVDEKQMTKTEVCKGFGIANFTLSAIIKNRSNHNNV